MTNRHGLEPIILRSPDALLAAIPYLLGFAPRSSAVLVWLADGRLLLTQRLDLPTRQGEASEWMVAAWGHAAADQADEMIVIIYADGDGQGWLVDLVIDRAAQDGIGIRDALRTTGEQWWSYLCSDAECCGPDGRVLAASAREYVGAELTVLGVAPMPDRESVAAALGPDPARQRATRDAMQELAPGLAPGEGRERWRDDAIDRILAALGVLTGAGPGRDSAGQAARDAVVVTGLADVRVRDTVLWEIARLDDGELRSVLSRLVRAMRAAPSGAIAPVATSCALTAWLSGDGARAVMCVERALQDDDEYSLAHLVGASLRSGLPPAAWRQATSALSRDECRHGSAPRPRQGETGHRRAG